MNLVISKKLFKSISIVLISLFFSLQSSGQNTEQLAMNENTNSGIFKFDTETLNYGKIVKNSDGKRVFKFKNIGKEPIIITKVKGSCGCTVASTPKDPILPNEMGEIEVKYATNRVGNFMKNITITSNASEAKKQIRIKGEVLEE